MLSILELPDPLRSTLKEMLRGRVSTAGEICESLDVQGEAANRVIDLLIEKGYLQATQTAAEEPRYCVVFAPKRGHAISDDL
jgi:predicted ArsR family transcriptional regulator